MHRDVIFKQFFQWVCMCFSKFQMSLHVDKDCVASTHEPASVSNEAAVGTGGNKNNIPLLAAKRSQFQITSVSDAAPKAETEADESCDELDDSRADDSGSLPSACATPTDWILSGADAGLSFSTTIYQLHTPNNLYCTYK